MNVVADVEHTHQRVEIAQTGRSVAAVGRIQDLDRGAPGADMDTALTDGQAGRGAEAGQVYPCRRSRERVFDQGFGKTDPFVMTHVCAMGDRPSDQMCRQARQADLRQNVESGGDDVFFLCN